MYSVVMMMALTGGAEAPDFGRRGCDGGCQGGCYGGGYVSCGGGCHGGRGGHGGLFRGRGHGGHGGCHGGGYGCAGGCYGGGYGGGFGCAGGCYGGGYGCAGGCAGGCYGGSLYGCYGGGMPAYGCHGCYGTFGTCHGMVPPPPPPDKKMKGKEEKKDGVPSGQSEAPAVILVNLPADATLTIDGNATRSVSSERRFVSPDLPVGRDYQYTLVAEVNRNGQMIRQSQRITVRAGEQTPVQFTFTEPAATASR